MQNMEMYVTAKDIAEGIQCAAGECPVALAFHRRFPEYNIAVATRVARFHFPGSPRVWKSFHLPYKVTKAITEFDEQGKMKPMRFTAVQI